MSLNPYKFFLMDNAINIKSKQVGTKDYDDIARFKLDDIDRRLKHQLDSIEDKDSDEYKRTLEYYEEFQDASSIEEQSNGNKILKNMPRVIDFIIMSKVSTRVEYYLGLIDGNKLGDYIPIYLSPEEEILQMLESVQKNIDEYKKNPNDSINTATYLQLIKKRKFLEDSLKNYLLISTPEKREDLDREMLKNGAFEERIKKNWYVFPEAETENSVKQFENPKNKQIKKADKIEKKGKTEETGNISNSASIKKEDDKNVNTSLDTAIEKILDRSGVVEENGRKILTRGTSNPYELVEKEEKRILHGYSKVPYRWTATVSRQPELIFEGTNSFKDRIFVYKFGDHLCQAMIGRPTKEFPQGKPTISFTSSILGISKVNTKGEIKNRIVIGPHVSRNEGVNDLHIKGNESFFADIYCSDELLDLAIKENGGYIGNFEKVLPKLEDNIPYSNYQMQYNSPFDIYLVSSLKLAFMDFVDALKYGGDVLGASDPYKTITLLDEYSNGKLVEKYDRNGGSMQLKEREINLGELFKKLESIQAEMQKKLLDRRNAEKNRNAKIPGED